MNMKNIIPKSATRLAAAVAMATSAGLSAAVLEEIVVTAQKREQNLQDVGVSVTAFSGDQIKSLGYTDTIDIIAQVPGLQMQQSHPTVTVFNIRGISQNDFADHLEAPVSVYIDDGYIGAMGAVHGSLFDIERVEVLRGPQGTLYGRNATGGLLHFISKKPTEELEGYGELTVAEYDQIRFEGAVGGSISDGILGRLSFTTNNHDGILKNRVGTDLRDADRYAVRGQLQIELGSDTELNLRAQYSENDETGNAFDLVNAIPNDQGLARPIAPNEDAWGVGPGLGFPRFREPDKDGLTGSFDSTGKFERETLNLAAKLTWDLSEKVTLTSITDYMKLDKVYSEDSDSSPEFFYIYNSFQEYDQFSQEFRLNGETDNMNWVAGLYYLEMDTDNLSQIDLDPRFFEADPDAFAPSFLFVGVDYKIESQSQAIFGQIDYQFSDNWSLIAGLRYTEDEREANSVFIDELSFPPGNTVFPYNTSVDQDAKQEWENFSAKLELDWRPSENTLTYVSVTRGHKAGNFAQPVFVPSFSLIPHDEEILTSYEIGYKGSLADGRVRINAAAFLYDYEDYQAFSLQGLEQAIFNKDATIKGAEIEVTWLTPIEGLEILFGASVLDGEVEDVSLPSGEVVDRDMPQAPDYSLNGLIRYEWSAFGGLMSAQVDANYNDDSYFSVFNGPAELQDAYSVANANISYTTNDRRFKITGFVKNLADEEYKLYTLDVSAISAIQNSYAPPRWYGATITYNF